MSWEMSIAGADAFSVKSRVPSAILAWAPVANQREAAGSTVRQKDESGKVCRSSCICAVPWPSVSVLLPIVSETGRRTSWGMPC